MRYIPLKEQHPDQAWVDKANVILEKLRNAPDDDARKKIIEDNSKVWGELKEWLLSLSYQKCWFSEAKDCFNHWDIEHYRPKKSAKDADKTEHMGYWWLAFDWTNFRICGNVGNRKKGAYFPLKEGNNRAGPADDIRLEEPTLLDPADPDDPSLISFNVEGEAILIPGCNDPWETYRVEYSIDRYNLNNYPPLVSERKKTWSNCWELVKQYLDELNSYKQTESPVSRNLFKEKAQQIRAMLKPDQEFSTVVRACLMSTGDNRVMSLLRTS